MRTVKSQRIRIRPTPKVSLICWLSFVAIISFVSLLFISALIVPKNAQSAIKSLNGINKSFWHSQKSNHGSSSRRRQQQMIRPLRIALICDEFTLSHLEGSFLEFIQLEPGRYAQQLQIFEPDFLFMESIWKGKDLLWKGANNHERPIHHELIQLVLWCKSRGIRTVFWSKEDPPNYHVFIKFAYHFDYVFTTSIEMVDEYEKDVPSAHVGLLPFAIQPQSHNPLGIFSRKQKEDSCFAGSWMGWKYPERGKSIEALFDGAKDMGRLAILDRVSTNLMAQHRFPDRFSGNVYPALDYKETLEFFKTCKVVLNVNSVPNSTTMLSRRVLEVPAMGVPLVTSRSAAIDYYLPPSSISVVNERAEARTVVGSILQWQGDVERGSALARRSLFIDHTYNRRLNDVMSQVGARFVVPDPVAIIFVFAELCPTSSRNSVLANFHRQQYDKKLLMIFLPSEYEVKKCGDLFANDPYILTASLRKDDVVSVTPITNAIRANLPTAETFTYFCLHMDSSSYYGRFYVRGMLGLFSIDEYVYVKKETFAKYHNGRISWTSGTQLEASQAVGSVPVLDPTVAFPLLSNEASRRKLYCVGDKYDFVANYYGDDNPRQPNLGSLSTILLRTSSTEDVHILAVLLVSAYMVDDIARTRQIDSFMRQMIVPQAGVHYDVVLLAPLFHNESSILNSKEICRSSERFLEKYLNNPEMKKRFESNQIQIIDPFAALHCSNNSKAFVNILSAPPLLKKLLASVPFRRSVKHHHFVNYDGLNAAGEAIMKSFEYDSAIVPASLLRCGLLSATHLKLGVYGDVSLKEMVLETPHNEIDDFYPFHLSRPNTAWIALSVLDPMLNIAAPRMPVFFVESAHNRGQMEGQQKNNPSKAAANPVLCFFAHSERYANHPEFLDSLAELNSALKTYGIELSIRDLALSHIVDASFVLSSSAWNTTTAEHISQLDLRAATTEASKEVGLDKCSVVAIAKIPQSATAVDFQLLKMEETIMEAVSRNIAIVQETQSTLGTSFPAYGSMDQLKFLVKRLLSNPDFYQTTTPGLLASHARQRGNGGADALLQFLEERV